MAGERSIDGGAAAAASARPERNVTGTRWIEHELLGKNVFLGGCLPWRMGMLYP